MDKAVVRSAIPSGHYKLEVLAVGGHGCQRERGDGVAVLGCNRSDCPDCIIRECLRRLQRSGSTLHRATLTHWPASEPGLGYVKENEVVDDLVSGMRVGSFAPQTALKGHGLTIAIAIKGGDTALPPTAHTTNRRTVRGLLEEIVGASNASPGDVDYDYPTANGVYRFQNPGGSAYPMGAELRHIAADQSWPGKPWRLVRMR
jgi:hypothetical protein